MSTPRTWQVAASTLGAPTESVAEVVDILTAQGVEVVELRAADDAQVHTHLTADERADIRDAFARAGIEVLAVAARTRVAVDLPDDEVVDDLRANIRLAADLGATFLRVFPGAPTHPAAKDELPVLVEPLDEVDERVVRRFAAAADLATRLQVRPVLETHDSHPRGEDVARVLRRLDEAVPGHPVGAIWDAMHPWRVGESPERSAAELLPYLTQGRGYVQIKDAASPADTTPVLQGSGAVPLDDVLDLLAAGGYAGPVSLEWERRWYPHVEPLGPALAAAVAAVRDWERRRA